MEHGVELVVEKMMFHVFQCCFGNMGLASSFLHRNDIYSCWPDSKTLRLGFSISLNLNFC